MKNTTNWKTTYIYSSARLTAINAVLSECDNNINWYTRQINDLLELQDYDAEDLDHYKGSLQAYQEIIEKLIPLL